jgi:hypothetical protein
MRKSIKLYTGGKYHFGLGIFLNNMLLSSQHNLTKPFKTALNRFAAMIYSEYKIVFSSTTKLTITETSRSSFKSFNKIPGIE